MALDHYINHGLFVVKRLSQLNDIKWTSKTLHRRLYFASAGLIPYKAYMLFIGQTRHSEYDGKKYTGLDLIVQTVFFTLKVENHTNLCHFFSLIPLACDMALDVCHLI